MATEYIRYPNNLGGGGSGDITIGTQVIGGTPSRFLLIDDLGNVAIDSLATRRSNNGHDTKIYSNFVGVGIAQDSASNPYEFQTLDTGITAVVTLNVNGTTDTPDSLVAAWNLVNPSTQILYAGTSGSTVIDVAQTVTFSGGTGGYSSGTLTIPSFGTNVYGSQSLIQNGASDFNLFSQGYNTELVGISGMSTVLAALSNGGSTNGVMLFAPGTVQITTQSAGGGAQLYLDAFVGRAEFGTGSVKFFSDASGFNAYTTNGNAANIIFPASNSGSVGDFLSITAISGTDKFVSFVAAPSGSLPTGSQEWQYLKWDTGTSLPVWNNLYALTEDTGSNITTAFGWKALGLSAANATPLGQYANTAIGSYALSNLAGIADNRNTALGFASGTAIPQSTRSTYVGYQVQGNGAVTSNDGAYFGADINISNGTGNNFFGISGQVGGTENAAFGYGNQVFGSQNLVFGNNNILTGAGASGSNIFLGSGLTNNVTSATTNFAAGFTAPGNLTSGTSNLMLFAGNNITSGSNNTALGQASLNTLSTGGNNIGIGGGDVATATTDQAIAIGESSVAALLSIAIGVGASAGQGSIAIGSNSVAPVNTFVAGSNSAQITDVYFGTGLYANGDYTIHGSESVLPTIAANTPGGALNILAGRGNGTGSGGALKLGSSLSGASGATQNPAFYAIVFDPAANTLKIGDPATSISGMPTLTMDYVAKVVSISNLQSFASDAAAGIGGLVAGNLYQNSVTFALTVKQ